MLARSVLQLGSIPLKLFLVGDREIVKLSRPSLIGWFS
jgi:hypothetical protein